MSTLSYKFRSLVGTSPPMAFDLSNAVFFYSYLTCADYLQFLPTKHTGTGREKRYNVIAWNKRPPILASTQQFISSQAGDEFYSCCRPVGREPHLPLALLDPVFAAFIEESQAGVLTCEDYAVARRLRIATCEFFEDNDYRASVLRLELGSYDMFLASGNIGSSGLSTHGHIDCNNRPVLILEVRNEIGVGSSEPSIQAMLYYDTFCYEYKLWKDASLHPCFILSLAGKCRHCFPVEITH